MTLDLDPAAGLDEIAAHTRSWIRAHLPAAWRDAAEAGRWADVDAFAADPTVTGPWFAEMGEAGLAGPTWPRERFGLGLDDDRAGVVADELGRYRAGRPIADFVGLSLAGPTILRWGDDAQKDRYLGPLARGEERWCQLFSEPGAGSDLAALETRAVRREDGAWVVDGQKVWSSFAHTADHGLLLARTDPGSPKHKGITYFLLDMTTSGVEARPLRQMTGDAEFNEVFLTDVVVPDGDRLGEVDQGWAITISTLMHERDGLTGRPVVGTGRVDGLIDRARETGTWSDPLVRDDLVGAFVHERVLQMATVAAVAGDRDGGPTAEGSIRKLANAVLEERMGLLGMDLAPSAAAGWEGAPPTEVGAYLAMKTSAIAGGTSEIQRNIIAERVLGLPRLGDPDRAVPFAERTRG